MPKLVEFGQGSQCIIGSYCSIADNVTILLGGNHRMGSVSTYPFRELEVLARYDEVEYCGYTNGDVIIGSDVWIGYDCTILSGATIGDGAVIGAGSVVRGNVPEYAVYLGSPAVFSRWRVDGYERRCALLTIKWWDWPEAKVREHAGLLSGNDIDEFIRVATCS